MKIIVAGAGRIGGSLAEVLAQEGHDITVIDRDEETLSHLADDVDVICLGGSATNSDILLEAGADSADLIIAVTEKDEVNMVCGISAHKLGTPYVVARVRDPEYLGKSEFLQEALGISSVVNPEYECAKAISRLLRFPSAARVDSFSRGSAEIVEHRVRAGGMLDGLQLKELQKKTDAKVLISLVERNGEAVIPNGNFTFAADDKLSITGTAKQLRKFFVAAGAYRRPIRSVIIFGGGRITIYLTQLLQEIGITVTVIEPDRHICEALSELIPEARIICGDAKRSQVLQEEGIATTDAFIALTDDDGDNIITSFYAKHCGVGKIVTCVNHEHFAEIMNDSDLDCVVAPKQIVVQQITRYVRAMSDSAGSRMETLYRLAEGKAEALEFIVGEDAKCTGIQLRDLRLKPHTLIACVIRGNRSILPDGTTKILPGDHAIVVTHAGRVKDLDDILEGA